MNGTLYIAARWVTAARSSPAAERETRRTFQI
ncbi:hypothetical protein EYF80_062074 [Liparis tanakae]|uniref:Uncharacterized protein n=1 Tax=Liparis tanakae TaxID=230148 RepID=A0A4Z2EGV9_9TELE|nr:hypothetical protein EYF80_062074 [Liparis tanakae]